MGGRRKIATGGEKSSQHVINTKRARGVIFEDFQEGKIPRENALGFYITRIRGKYYSSDDCLMMFSMPPSQKEAEFYGLVVYKNRMLLGFEFGLLPSLLFLLCVRDFLF